MIDSDLMSEVLAGEFSPAPSHDVILEDGDYILKDGCAWFGVKGFSIRIASTDDGVVVRIFKKGDEMGPCLNKAYALDDDVEDDA